MEKFKSNLAFIDILFQLLIVLTTLMWLATLLIHDPGKKEIVTAAQVLVTLKWPHTRDVDMDLWIMDSGGAIEGYQSSAQGAGFMSLERDDTGNDNETFSLAGQTYRNEDNSEVITIRKAMPGEYKVSVHFYGGWAGDGVPIEVQVIQVNPQYKVVYRKKVVVDKQRDEMAVFRFYVNDEGIVYDVEEEPPTHFVIGTRFGDGRKTYKPNELKQIYNSNGDRNR